MIDYVWHHVKDTMTLDPDLVQYEVVIVLAWHETTATVLPLADGWQRVEGATPYLVKTSALRFGAPPVREPIPA